ncbi:hypothetical protein R50073_31410 [Maricurvus nonylphenolicus]|uniref:YheU family protein n=1 Tax=Maricurvus nonylphenolicus TaxID=1008307 RepID=UPI0036F1CC27
MIIPFQQISADALQGLIEDYVSRDGTDYGVQEVSLESKADQVKRQLQRGEVVVVFDEVSETASILTQKEVDHAEQDQLAGRSTEDEWFASGHSQASDELNQDQWQDDFNQDV